MIDMLLVPKEDKEPAETVFFISQAITPVPREIPPEEDELEPPELPELLELELEPELPEPPELAAPPVGSPGKDGKLRMLGRFEDGELEEGALGVDELGADEPPKLAEPPAELPVSLEFVFNKTLQSKSDISFGVV